MKRCLFPTTVAVFVLSSFNVPATVHYVDLNGTNPTSPYTSWATAATNIQNAIDVAATGDQVLVTNGIYQTGGRVVSGVTNRIVVPGGITVQSVNGPAVTLIRGYQIPGTTNGASAVRCAYLVGNAALIGFTLTNGATGSGYDYGGGIWCDTTSALISNCVLTANCAAYQGGATFHGTLAGCTLTGNVAFDSGGAAYGGVLTNCVLTGNLACAVGGGAAYQSTLLSCTLAGNTAYRGGGTESCTLINCTITNNQVICCGGGALYSTLNNCSLIGNSSVYGGGGAEICTLSNCVLNGNSAQTGGGAYGCTMYNCTLSANAATDGGGTYGGNLGNCILTGNTAQNNGGGVCGSGLLTNCTLTANSAMNNGGGAYSGTLGNCVLTGNTAQNIGGGACVSTLYNCAVAGNVAGASGGGVIASTLTNCTVTGNAAPAAGGATSSTLVNCIVYYNSAAIDANCSSNNTLNYCCTVPLPVGATNTITAAPQLTSISHLSAGSPCRGAGDATSITGSDIDGEAWANPPSIGCDEPRPATATGPLSVAIQAAYTNASPGYALDFVAAIAGDATASRWDFGDGTVVSNLPYASHSWTASGNYTVVLTAYNASYPGGVSATVNVHVVTAPVQYVSLSSPNPVAPYTSWTTAATNIQDAVDAGFVGGVILVNDGVYNSGGRVLVGSTNRLVVTKPMTIRSLNGPAVTTVDGAGLMRCAYLADGVVLAGFTLTNGTTLASGGGLWCNSASVAVSNCVLAGNFAGNQGGGTFNGTLSGCTLGGNSTPGNGGGACLAVLVNCTLNGNRATNYAGGAYSSTLTGCTLAGNSALFGGGASDSTLDHCTLTGNSASDSCGGAWGGTLVDCLITDNTAVNVGGGVASATLNRCTLSGNVAGDTGGGAFSSTLNSCALANNSARNRAGGAYLSTLTNCTVTGDSAFTGGGADSCTLNNSILFYNLAAVCANYSANSILNYCCTTPLPPGSSNNISASPQLASASHLSAGSPCRGAGSTALAAGTDIDGEAWANPPSIGCDELHPGLVAGALNVAIQASATNVAAGFAVDFVAQIFGPAAASRWDFGDGTVVSNQPYVSYSWASPGDHVVTLTAYNDSAPGGVSASVTVQVIPQPVHYVSLDSTNPLAPYASWATAATNLQDAVDAASEYGALILVTNGTYSSGMRIVYGGLPNRLAVTKPVLVLSVNGPNATFIQGNPGNGDSAVRCVYLADNAVLSGFTLTQGATLAGGDSSREQSGGGLWCESAAAVATNCVLVGNSANFGGGGVAGGSLINCLIATNSASSEGGGADYAALAGCTLSGNSESDWWSSGGGGACFSVLTNCILSGNSGYYGGGAASSTLTGCELVGNYAGNAGGGAGASRLSLCTVSNNSAYWSGGGMEGTLLDRCTVTGNKASYGGGAENSTLRSCVLTANSGRFDGGGADGSTLNNCNVIGNSSSAGSGGVSGSCVLNNCILFYNTGSATPNYPAGTVLNYCCTYPQPPNGAGNIAADPQLAGLSHISVASPCRGAGSVAYTSGFDIDGESWLNPPSVGCDEIHAGAATNALSVAIAASFTNTTPGLPLDFTAQISGQATSSRWEFDDGTVVSNQPYASHSWVNLGDYPVVLRAFNDAYPDGVSATVTVHVVTQPVFYVALSNATPVAPYTSWATAATNIQDAVDAVNAAGALVLVGDGVYPNGARLANNDVPHRVVIDKPITVRSVNGPDVTSIQGQPYDGSYGAIRCAYLTAGATLSGFTLTNGAAMPGWAETSSDNRTCGGIWCTAPTAVVSNCVIVTCSAADAAGGAYGGTLINCTLTNNSAGAGGGAYGSSLINCILAANSAGGGGGAYSSSLSWCQLTGNSADTGGGAGLGTLNNCTFIGNHAGTGGAADSCSVSNSAMVANSASDVGGGANASLLYNCTLTGNAATNSGGGVFNCTNFDSIVYDNFAPAGSNWFNSSFSYCCTVPLPPGGSGNLSADPQLADAFHLSTGSPCRGAGLFPLTSGFDLDGDVWLNPPSIGCDEFQAGTITGPLSVVIATPYTNVAAGFPLSFQAVIAGHAAACQWDFGDGTVVSNRPFISHTWASPGDFAVVLTAYNESFPFGVSTALTVHVQAPIHYVALNNPSPAAPYTSWATAATNIQDAVDATFVGGTIFVSNGVYQTGGRVGSSLCSNRVSVTRQLTLLSVNGPAFTVIAGAQPSGPNAVRCVSLVRNCVLAGFTLTGGGTRTDGDGDLDQSGAGLWCDSASLVVSNCIITGNSGSGIGGVQRGSLHYCVISTNSPGGASGSVLDHCTVAGNSSTGAGGCTLTFCLIEGNSSYDAGGLYGCTLTNCIIRGNYASRYGGGSEASTMYNCLVISNTAGYGGGGLYNDWAYNCTIVNNSAGSYGGGVLIASWLANCILDSNAAPNGPNYWSDNLNYCCATPYYGGGPGNFTGPPQFVNPAAGDFHLQTNSPCVNTGDNGSASSGTDLDGNPRIVGSAVDIGAYELQTVIPFQAAIQAAFTNSVPGYPVSLAGYAFGGAATSSSWDFGDGTTATNTPTLSHSWSLLGDYTVVYRAFNAGHPAGVSATLTMHVLPALVCHVDAAGTNPVFPYASWTTAATNIQDAADVASLYATAYVLVTNGNYQTGGRAAGAALTNRVIVPAGVTVRSVNGPTVTAIQGNPVMGDSAIRCLLLSNNAALGGFRIVSGSTRNAGDADLEQSGGGAWCADNSVVLSNCTFVACSANNNGGAAIRGTFLNCAFITNSTVNGNGGAVEGGTLGSCTLLGNSAPGFGARGGGVHGSIAIGSTFVGNSAFYGGAAESSTLSNCVATFNSSPYAGGAGNSCTFYSCLLATNTSGYGGGAATYGSAQNCVFLGNSAPNGGGAAWQVSLNNCLLVGNATGGKGGAANSYSNLRNCTVAGNSAGSSGGGVDSSTLWNCIVYSNTAPSGSNYSASTLNFCCTMPRPASGSGNITNGPAFVNLAGGNLRLKTTSPAINVGTNAYAPGSLDLDGRPRIVGSTVDMGAYEFQGAGMSEFIGWLQQYGLATDGSADYVDADGDGLNNWQEWQTGTNPTNALSVFRMASARATNNPPGLVVTWQSVSGISYFLQRGTNLGAPPAFSTIRTNITGQAGTTSYTDTNATGFGPYFYRAGVP
ncbi:MAG TPA: PKD domain-containing protein [Candidatus Acidoferrum sp.]|nr:PKD domain-containing protein [Candidatus Acidoferrum sp.]